MQSLGGPSLSVKIIQDPTPSQFDIRSLTSVMELADDDKKPIIALYQISYAQMYNKKQKLWWKHYFGRTWLRPLDWHAASEDELHDIKRPHYGDNNTVFTHV